MPGTHTYAAKVTWTGNAGEGTAAYRSYTRDYDIACAGRPVIRGSADPAYLGDARRHNPEDLLVGSLSACHMLWYLHLCASNGIVVTDYEDAAEGAMRTRSDGAGEFTRVTLRPPRHGDGGERPGGRGAPPREGRRDVLHRALGQLPGRPRAGDRRCLTPVPSFACGLCSRLRAPRPTMSAVRLPWPVRRASTAGLPRTLVRRSRPSHTCGKVGPRRAGEVRDRVDGCGLALAGADVVHRGPQTGRTLGDRPQRVAPARAPAISVKEPASP